MCLYTLRVWAWWDPPPPPLPSCIPLPSHPISPASNSRWPFARQVVHLTWWAVCRDSVYYTLSVIVLIAVSSPCPCKGPGALPTSVPGTRVRESLAPPPLGVLAPH